MKIDSYLGEIWKDIIGYEGLYQVSNYGRVKSLERIVPHKRYGEYKIKEKLIKGSPDKKGHIQIKIGKLQYIHKLVAKYFVYNDDPINKDDVHHIDGNKDNNNADNLMWINHNKHTALHQSMQINQYDLDGKFIKKWDSSMEIERELGYCHQNIIKCCKGEYSYAYNYIWRYA